MTPIEGGTYLLVDGEPVVQFRSMRWDDTLVSRGESRPGWVCVLTVDRQTLPREAHRVAFGIYTQGQWAACPILEKDVADFMEMEKGTVTIEFPHWNHQARIVGSGDWIGV